MRVSIHYRYGGYWLADATDKEASTYYGTFEVPDEFWERYQKHLEEEREVQRQIARFSGSRLWK